MQVVPQRVTAAQFAAKFRSKKEVFQFLTVDCKAYLPPYTCLTIYFLKALADGSKKFVKCEDVKYLYAPHFEGLSIADLFQKASEYPQVENYLPIKSELGKVPRQFLVNIIHSIVGDPFSQWVVELINRRNEKLVQSQNMLIQLDPEVADAFARSTSVSTNRGVGCHLLKISSKRRRTQAQMQGQDTREEVMATVELESRQRIEELEQQLKESQEEIRNNAAAAQILNGMIQCGDAEVENDGSVSVSKKKPQGGSMMEHSFNI